MDWQEISAAFDVQPWFVSSDYPAPRFPRLRWKFRRVWPLKRREIPAPSSPFSGVEARERAFVEHELEPHMRAIEAELNRQIRS